VKVTRGQESVGGTSIMGLMMLAAGPGTTITVEASGREAKEVLDALELSGKLGNRVRIGIIDSSRTVLRITVSSSARRAASSMTEVGEASTTTSARGKSLGLAGSGPSVKSNFASVQENRS
jgi:hypothetical protein